VAVSVLVAVTSACNGDATGTVAKETAGAVHVETIPVTTEDVDIVVQAVGTLQPESRVEIRTRNPGVVSRVLVEDGQHVELAALLVQLDTRKLAAEVRLREAALEAARARAVNARTTFRRARDLATQGFIPQQELDDARAEAEEATAAVAEAEAALLVARTVLDDSGILSPLAGIAGEVVVDVGDYLQTGDHVLTITDSDPVEVDFAVPEEHLGRLATGRAVSVQVPSYADEEFRGTITYVAPEVHEQTRAVRLKARIPNPDGRLRPGQFATVRAVLDVRAQARLVPEEAIVPEGTTTWIYVVEDGHAVRREVALGIRRRGRVEVTTGLTGTETVVVNGQLRLRDGTPVVAAAATTSDG
jgi:membrane fusion protein (multidrug efflux system)